MEPTLKESITAIFGAEAPPTEPVVKPPAPVEPEKPIATDIGNLIEEAQQHYNQAQYLKAGDWAGYGKEQEALKAVVGRLAELAAEEKR